MRVLCVSTYPFSLSPLHKLLRATQLTDNDYGVEMQDTHETVVSKSAKEASVWLSIGRKHHCKGLSPSKLHQMANTEELASEP
jgi:hypothetical protein